MNNTTNILDELSAIFIPPPKFKDIYYILIKILILKVYCFGLDNEKMNKKL